MPAVRCGIAVMNVPASEFASLNGTVAVENVQEHAIGVVEKLIVLCPKRERVRLAGFEDGAGFLRGVVEQSVHRLVARSRRSRVENLPDFQHRSNCTAMAGGIVLRVSRRVIQIIDPGTRGGGQHDT